MKERVVLVGHESEEQLVGPVEGPVLGEPAHLVGAQRAAAGVQDQPDRLGVQRPALHWDEAVPAVGNDRAFEAPPAEDEGGEAVEEGSVCTSQLLLVPIEQRGGEAADAAFKTEREEALALLKVQWGLE